MSKDSYPLYKVTENYTAADGADAAAQWASLCDRYPSGKTFNYSEAADVTSHVQRALALCPWFAVLTVVVACQHHPYQQ
ncbi:hypothetical protein [Medusavirus stheno T3]|uniref:Uncharacterized protein n=1 Tax=Medusavirus stheno T3 TaxID=3069717 RepID=A0A7S7YFB9_9VIRU|nr:hypothetical protein QKU73_gp300 [Acanthamoeba castellanii medusavirus]QPB44475.1 hypothetical protein [Medusavirus stheno T3]